MSQPKAAEAVFSRQLQEDCNKIMTPALVKKARRSGMLDLAWQGLGFVPEKVWTMELLDDQEVRNLEVDMKLQEGEKWWEYSPLTLLNLSHNNISQLSPDIANLDALSVLRLTDNNIQSLPPEIGKLRNLMELYVDNNHLKTLPDECADLNNLLILNVANNELEEITFDMASLNMLQTLDLSCNSLTLLPPGIDLVTQLSSLDVSHNKLVDITPDIVFLCVLRQLMLNDNKITELPPLGALRKLQVVNIANNLLTKLPDFTDCQSLKEVYVGYNAIEALTESDIDALRGVRIFDIKNNLLTALPENLHMLFQIVRFDVRDNKLNNLPCTISLLPHLSHLQLEGNPMKEMRHDIIQCGTSYLLQWMRKKLEDLHPEGLGEKVESSVEFPDRHMLKAVQSLNLAKQELTEVPETVFEECLAAAITEIDLSINKLVDVPDGLQKLSEIATQINLQCNLLQSIPAFIGDFANLECLNLQSNRLTELPESFSKLVRLRELILTCNKFAEIPVCIGSLPSLLILDIKGNYLSSIDVELLSQLKNLLVLDLSNNNIASVPPQLGLLNVKTLKLEGNCFRHPRQSILLQGTVALLAYLRDRIPKE